MAIATDSYITLNDTDKIGLSDTLDNYSIDDIKASGYVGAYDPLRTNCRTATKKSMWSGMEEQKTPFNPEWTGSPYPWSHKIYAGDGTYTGEVFIAVVWLYRNIPGLTAKVINESNISDYKLVTEMPANKMYYTVPSLYSWNSQVCATSWSEERTYPSSYYAPDTGTLDYHSNYGDAGDISVQVDDIYPYMMFEYDGYLYFQLMTQQVDYYASWMINSETSSDWDITPYDSSALTPFTEDSGISLGTSYNAVSRSGEANSLNGCNFNIIVPYDGSAVWAGPADYSEVYGGCIDSSGKYLPYYCFGGAGSYYSTFRCFATLATKADSLLYFGNSGVKIIADKPYKPIITDGVVTGITDDMNEPSELDNWDMGTTDHGVSPSGPPTPPTPEGDDIDDHEMGAGSGISGMANLWLLTKSQLDDLHSAFNSAPGGFDPLNSLISVMGLGVAPTYLFNDIEVITPINIRKSDGTSWSTGVEGHIVDAQKSAFQFVGITVNRKYNNFLDYSPYAIHEIFIPMCGWLTLPDIAVDRSITVTYLPDVESLKCRAVVSVVDNSGNRCVIGEKDGIMGADVPFTNTGHSLYVGEAIINGMNVAGEVITGAIGAGFTKTNAKGGTYRPYEGFTVGMGGTLPGAIGNALVSGQTNRTHYMTGNGTRIGFSDGENIQIKSTYHNIDKPNNYDHTVGKVCNKTGLLSSFNGFTVCDNPHINISALEDEKSEIKALLEQGVILPSGE